MVRTTRGACRLATIVVLATLGPGTGCRRAAETPVEAPPHEVEAPPPEATPLPPQPTPTKAPPAEQATAEHEPEDPGADKDVGGLPLDGLVLVDRESFARAVALAREALSVRLEQPPADRTLEEDREWRQQVLLPWEKRRRFATRRAREAALELRGSPQGDVAAAALEAALHDDAMAQLFEVPVPTVLETDPDRANLHRMGVTALAISRRTRADIAFTRCWLGAQRLGPDFQDLADACRAGMERLAQRQP